MGTYFHGNQEIQGDGLQTLILMNPGGGYGYSSAANHHHHPPPPPPNFSFLNSTSAAGGGTSTSSGQQFVGIPLPIVSHAQSVDTPSHHGQIPRFPYHLYGSMEQGTPPRDVTRSQQGLSLTLSSQQVGGISRPSTVLSPTSGGGSPSSASGVSNGGGGVGNGVQSVLLGSKYLKATQELLEETVNVGKGIRNGKSVGVSGATAAAGEGESSGKSSVDLTTAERQEIQMKKAKLVHMLDEVEQRYRQYDHQMQVVISWFEQVAGIGSARTYTSLALQTISKQFRCLKDTILTQIKAASKSLGEEDGENEGSRLKFVDHQIRQQKALQQLGMIQPNAWRPQRGLPERSVSVLRAWLFEHFLHPYPKDSDKQILAKQTGLTRSQVSNWFINARVRLWKPMVEEMYLEEVKENENSGLGEKKTDKDDDNNNKSSAIQTKNQDNNNLLLIHNNNNQNNSPTGLSIRNSSLFSLVDPSEMDVSIQSPKKQRNNNNEMMMISSTKAAIGDHVDETMNDQFSIKFDTGQRQQQQNRDRFSLLGSPTNLMGGFGSYPIGEIEQFAGPYPGNNGVSLTLGLPHCENLSMSATHHHHLQSFLPNNHNTMQIGRRVELGHEENEYEGLNSPTSSHTPIVYETVNLQNRKRFAAQLMHDFVA